MNNLNSKESFISIGYLSLDLDALYEIYISRANQSLVSDSVAVCSFIDKREIGIFLQISSRQITRLRCDRGFFSTYSGIIYISEISREKSFIRFLSDHPLNLEWRKKGGKKSVI